MYYSAEGFSIRSFQYGDEASLALSANCYDIWSMVRDVFPHPYTYDDAIQWVDLNVKLNPPVNFAIDVNGDVVGTISLIRGTDIHKQSMEIGYWISKDYWGKGIAKESVKWIVQHCFENYNINRIWASVFEHNIASQKVLENNGFEHEATLKQNIFKNGHFLDEYIFAFLKS